MINSIKCLKKKKKHIDIIQNPKEFSTNLTLNNSKEKIKNDYIGLTDVNYNQYIKLRQLWVKYHK